MGFPGSSDGRESACNAEDLSLTSGLRRSPGEGNGYPTPVFLPGESDGQRSLDGYRPWSCKQWDTTEQLTFSRFFRNTLRIKSTVWALYEDSHIQENDDAFHVFHLLISQQCGHFMKIATSKRMMMLFVFSIFSLQKLLKIEKYCFI